jgi:hypothetical protein
MASERQAFETISQIPDDLREDATKALNKVGAFLGSKGDPLVMASFKDAPGFMTLTFLTLGLAFVLWIIAMMSNYYEVRNNWAHYRCMPSVAPFSKFYGHDLKETMNFCVGEQVKEHAPEVLNPIYAGINQVQGVVDGVYTKVEVVETGIMGLLKKFTDFVIQFMNSFRLLGVRVRMSLILVRQIFDRVFGIFISFAYAAISALTFGENMICNPLVVFIGTIAGSDLCCFEGSTMVRLVNGEVRPISAIQIGDRLADEGIVTSLLEFDGLQTKMVDLYGVRVSANHAVLIYDSYNGAHWVPAGKHPYGFPCASLNRLWCLNTTTNHIPILSPTDIHLQFTDYEESSEPAVIRAAQAVAEKALNGSSFLGEPVDDYSLGLDPRFMVRIHQTGELIPLSSVKIGDILEGGSTVIGVIQEECETVYTTPYGYLVAGAQLLRSADPKWFRAANRFATKKGEAKVLLQLVVHDNSSITVYESEGTSWQIRDYNEWDGANFQRVYDESLGLTDKKKRAKQSMK